ncbi:helix-turn-helix domain-containing protein [Nucisporomicrobium flavum]|jgi:DNA-binding XRE family transcriptional regulator|uniref:helix-turn-helix domain-containing protein n=2 Tax=Nucisporomicrobium flavum TaxID=2785915 RepID=UPI0018F478F4|nr:helix-turn-helix domain-containing protein [Nucisporomicrobium flavum]
MQTSETGDPRAVEARRLRAETRISLAQLRKHFGVSRDTMAAWLWNEPTPEWTRRPNAKDDLRDRAVDLRHAGYTVPEIAAELNVSKSTAYLWVRHLPLDETSERAHERRSEHSRRIAETRWEPLRQKRDADRAATNEAEAAWVGALSDREVRLLGAVAYWCEGAKSKPWEPNRCRVTFINSDPALILLFIRFVESFGQDRDALRYRVSIHESADAEAAGRWWAAVVGVPFAIFRRPTLKTHNPSTVRYNVGDPYRGCLVVDVPRSRQLYWRIEGMMRGVASATELGGDATM